MKTKSSFHEHLKLSTATVSKWPEWKRTAMGGKTNASHVCSTGTSNHDACKASSGCKKAK